MKLFLYSIVFDKVIEEGGLALLGVVLVHPELVWKVVIVDILRDIFI